MGNDINKEVKESNACNNIFENKEDNINIINEKFLIMDI